MSSPCADFIRFDAITVLLGKMVFEISPQRISPVADKNAGRQYAAEGAVMLHALLVAGTAAVDDPSAAVGPYST